MHKKLIVSINPLEGFDLFETNLQISEGISLQEGVAMLSRPYRPISEDQWEVLFDMATRTNCDVLSNKNGTKLFTFGNADGGYALMPIVCPDRLEVNPRSYMKHSNLF